MVSRLDFQIGKEARRGAFRDFQVGFPRCKGSALRGFWIPKVQRIINLIDLIKSYSHSKFEIVFGCEIWLTRGHLIFFFARMCSFSEKD